MTKGIGGHQAPVGQKDEWLTPPDIISALGGPDVFDLDPASPVNRPWSTAKQHYTVDDDGLKKSWHGLVWLNPPYGGPSIIGPWMKRMVEHGSGIALLFARTETEVFFETVWREASAVKFIRGRLHFHHVDGTRAKHNGGAPSVLVAYGGEAAARIGNSSIPGRYLKLR